MSRTAAACALSVALVAGVLGVSLLDGGPLAGEFDGPVGGTWKLSGTGRNGTVRLALTSRSLLRKATVRCTRPASFPSVARGLSWR